MLHKFRGSVIWAFGLFAAIVACALLCSFAIHAHTLLVNPAVRQAIVHDPNRDISTTQAFHTKLGDIISADGNIIGLIQQEQRYRQSHPNWQSDNYYANLDVMLTGIEQARETSISDYNQFSDNPDNAIYRHAWLPVSIPATALPADEGATIAYLNKEITQLSAAYNHN